MPRAWVRWLTVVLIVALGLSASAWLLWAALYHSDPQVGSRLVSFRVVDGHRVDVTILVDRGSDVAATCRVVAQDAAGGVVGASTFLVPAGGASSVMVTESVTTERRAANAVLGVCTTPGQPQPR